MNQIDDVAPLLDGRHWRTVRIQTIPVKVFPYQDCIVRGVVIDNVNHNP